MTPIQGKPITPEFLAGCAAKASVSDRLVSGILSNHTPDSALLNPLPPNAHTWSLQLDNWKATSQASSGRCWLFALSNLMRGK
ncbi:peptidase C1B, bleomycin hydrolase, partial [Kipferlia bialata]|eukprot:g15592.t1